MNTPDDWKREAAESKPCPYCKGRGYTPATYASGEEPCGCDEAEDDE